MPSQTLLWTALPNGMRRDERGATFLRLSAVVSPRLTPDGGAPGILQPFGDFVDWPAKRLAFTARFFLGDDPAGGPRKDVPAARVTPRGTSWPSSDLWKALFPPDTSVRPYKFVGLDDRTIRSYSVRAVANFVSAQYGKLGSVSYAQLPLATTLLDENSFAFGSLGFYDPSFHDKGGPGIEAAAVGVGKSFREVKEFHRLTAPAASVFNRPPKPPQFDFHDAVAALGEYPTLLRALGLVVDLEVPFSEDLLQTGKTPFSVAVVPFNAPPPTRPGVPPPVRAVPLPNCILPRTSYQLNASRSLFLPQPSPNSDLSLGLLKLGGGGPFDVVQFDVDGAAEKLLNFAYNLQRTQDKDRRSADTPDTAGAPALRTSGVSLVRNARGEQLHARFLKARTLNDKFQRAGQSSQLLNAEDVVRGYRIDVLDVTPVRGGVAKPAVWRSLCRRDGFYTFTKTGATLQLSDEGIVSTGVTQAASKETDPAKDKAKDDLCLHESLFTWDGWSLSAPRPGKAIGNPDQQGVEQAVERLNPPAAAIPLSVEFHATKGTLPRMRYGRRYRLRARAVDLAGNSVPLAGGEVVPALNTDEFTCVRYEPVAAPVVFTTEPAKEGESLERVVIRSDVNTHVIPSDEAVRHVAPPKCGQTLAEAHGMFDGADGLPRKDAYATIIAKEGAFEPHPTQGFVDASGLRLDADRSVILPYLPDPLARGAAFRVAIGPAESVTETFKTCDFGNDRRRWPEAKPWRLRLVEHQGNESAPRVFADETARVLTVALRKAEVARVRLSSRLNDADLELLGVWQWIKQFAQTNGDAAQAMKLGGDAASGLNWLLTPFRELVLVHAVQRPLTPPVIQGDGGSLEAKKTKAGDTAAWLLGRNLEVDGKSTSKVDIRAEWAEVTDDPLRLLPDDKPGTRHRAVVLEIPVHETQTEFEIKEARHEFGDTKYRKVSYTAVATTRFREYFPPDTSEEALTRVSHPVSHDILSSAAAPTCRSGRATSSCREGW